MAIDRTHSNLEDLIKKLRYITAAVQIIPFIYSAIYVVCMVLYLFCSEDVVKLCDAMFYVSPVTVGVLLVLSKLLRMCIWHRAACMIPILPQTVSLVDYYIVRFPGSAAMAVIITAIVSVSILLFSAYKTFMK